MKDKKLRLVIEADSIFQDNPSGISYAVSSILHELNLMSSERKDLQVVAIFPKEKKKQAEKIGLNNIEVKYLPFKYKYINFLLTKLRFTLPADLIFGKGVYLFPNYKNWLLLRSKSLTFVHDLSFLAHPETVEPDNREYLSKFSELWMQRSSKILAISEYTKKEIGKHFSSLADKTEVVHLGVDNKVYKKIPRKEASGILNKHGIPKDFLLYLGNIEPRKNIDVLIRAYSRLFRGNPLTPPLVIIGGGGWLNKKTLNKIDELSGLGIPIIRNRSYVEDSDIPAIFSSAKLLIHPAIYEGFGLSVLQAMSCGTPALISRATSLPEVGGQAAHYFNPSSELQLYKKIKLLLENKLTLDEMSKKGPPQAGKFSWRSTADKIVSISKDL